MLQINTQTYSLSNLYHLQICCEYSQPPHQDINKDANQYWLQSQALQHTNSSFSPAGLCITYHNYLSAAAYFSPPHSPFSQCFVSLCMRMLWETNCLAKVNIRSTPFSSRLSRQSSYHRKFSGWLCCFPIHQSMLTMPIYFPNFHVFANVFQAYLLYNFLRVKVKLAAL